MGAAESTIRRWLPPSVACAAALLLGPATAGAWLTQYTRHVQVDTSCREIAARLASVSLTACRSAGLEPTGARSVQGRPILAADYPAPRRRPPLGRVLLLGGIHGDELSSVSIVFTWLELIHRHRSGLFDWRLVPVLNPDGLLERPARRMNARAVDLNRNFPSPDWHEQAERHWVEGTGSNPRRYPGPAPLSEPESAWLHAEIERFRPDVIVSVHAPLEVVDFDGPPDPPRRLGSLRLDPMGTYPGSLGRFAGVQRGLPVVTIELPHAGIMPSRAEQARIWGDLVSWLHDRLAPVQPPFPVVGR